MHTPSTVPTTSAHRVARPSRVAARRTASLLPALLAGLLVPGLVGTPAALAAPPSPALSPRIEPLAAYQPQTTCSPTAKPGTTALMRTVLRAYPGTGNSGIVRACAVGGRSEHKEGRAWDWRVDLRTATQAQQATDLMAWLLGPDSRGNKAANARRLGVMYVVWNRKIWSSYAAAAGWRPYAGTNPHTGHAHISLDWAGGMGLTSYWSGRVHTAPTPPVRTAPPATAPPTDDHDHGPEQAEPAKPATPARPATPGRVPVLDDDDLPATFRVPARPGGTTTPFALAAGTRYELQVSGAYAYGDGVMQADGECSVHPDDPRSGWWPRSQWEGSPGRGHLDLVVAGASAWTPLRDTGRGCDASHTYRAAHVPQRTGPLAVRVDDDHRADNSGSLLLTVLRLPEQAEQADDRRGRGRGHDGTRGRDRSDGAPIEALAAPAAPPTAGRSPVTWTPAAQAPAAQVTTSRLAALQTPAAWVAAARAATATTRSAVAPPLQAVPAPVTTPATAGGALPGELLRAPTYTAPAPGDEALLGD